MNLKKHFFSTVMILVCCTVVIAQPVTVPTIIEGVEIYTNAIDSGLLRYNQIKEKDSYWEKKVWRIIDVREKRNAHFAYPDAPLVSIIFDAIKAEEITTYSLGYDNEFQKAYSKDEINSILFKADTIRDFDPVTFEEEVRVIYNEVNPDDIKRFRVKEVWFFDEETSTMQVRIIGIAPIRSIYSDRGDFKYEMPMFWVYYPELREVLATKQAMNPFRNEIIMYWDDVFENRFFSSYIIEESNVYGRRIRDYMIGVDGLLEAERIKNDLFSLKKVFWND